MAKAPNRKHKPENCFRLSPNCHRPSIDPQLPIRLPLDSFHPCPNYETAATRGEVLPPVSDRKSTRLNSSHLGISYAVFCLKKKKKKKQPTSDLNNPTHTSRLTTRNTAE